MPALQAGGRRFDPDRLHQFFGTKEMSLEFIVGLVGMLVAAYFIVAISMILFVTLRAVFSAIIYTIFVILNWIFGKAKI